MRNLMICGTLVVVWLILFVIGFHVDSETYRQTLESIGKVKLGMRSAGAALLVALFAWTWTNCLLLSGVASLLGEAGRVVSGHRKREPDYRAALARGFFVYLLVMSGQMIIGGGVAPVSIEGTDGTATNAAHYFRVASVVSLLGFAVGFNPKLFSSLLERIARQVEAEDEEPESEER